MICLFPYKSRYFGLLPCGSCIACINYFADSRKRVKQYYSVDIKKLREVQGDRQGK